MFLRHRQLTHLRTLFKKIKPAQFRIESEAVHHEYSIGPESFAFKVSSDIVETDRKAVLENSTDASRAPGDASESHPLVSSAGKAPNLIEAIYKNATNYPFKNQSPQDAFRSHPTTTAVQLAHSKKRPIRCKMRVSDFIDDSLYNRHYGYFSKEVEIFHTEKPFDYNNFRDADEFLESWKNAYLKYDDAQLRENSPFTEHHNTPAEPAPAAKSDTRLARYARVIQKQDLQAVGEQPKSRKSLQLWHTPTELFSPHYGEAIARYILVNYKLNGCYPYEDLIIYEIGGGNGTLMCNILNYIKTTEPDIYARSQYKIIEITSQLALKQLSLALRQKLVSQGLDYAKLEIYNKSIFDWDVTVDDNCFFIALEVFDNFAHDVVRYEATTGEPYEGHVLVDKLGDFYQFYTPELSYHTNLFLQLRENGPHAILPQANSWAGLMKLLASLSPFAKHADKVHPLLFSQTRLSLQNRFFPLKDNLTPGEFIPTRLLQFFRILKHRFPHHLLICSDFHAFSNTIPGYYNAPVVQTVVKDRMVDVSTYMCYQGYFDIMFPTDFALVMDMYRQITGKLAKVEHHLEFLEQWADVEATTTKTGENPMLEFYRNASFMVS